MKKKVVKQAMQYYVPQELRDRLLELNRHEAAIGQAQDRANDLAARQYAGLGNARRQVWKEIFDALGIDYNPDFAKPEWTLELKTSTLRRLTKQERDAIAARTLD